MGDLVQFATAAAVVCTAVVGGVFFALSSFVMPALARLEPAAGIVAMQSINVRAVRPAFMLALFGTAAVATVVGIARFGDPLIVAAAAVYLVGVIGVTIVAHVPRNDALAAVDPRSAAAAETWRRYLTGWCRWNHMRWIGAVVSSSLFLAAILR
ncbi:anthrone oxygenase family protein [Microbacterium sp. SA39]|uniref:anthrone oxygenase family protein n=1 Tax=Microbacterium sp. SA39 TaxID=1263625 RepID=UPI0005FA7B2B|nr:anthrone oxygenase family protein [Microbacterium sp. SA39]KJQ56074.1 hypothetical protein RS85_00055 [Microbacterium sp. SA39]